MAYEMNNIFQGVFHGMSRYINRPRLRQDFTAFYDRKSIMRPTEVLYGIEPLGALWMDGPTVEVCYQMPEFLSESGHWYPFLAFLGENTDYTPEQICSAINTIADAAGYSQDLHPEDCEQ